MKGKAWISTVTAAIVAVAAAVNVPVEARNIFSSFIPGGGGGGLFGSGSGGGIFSRFRSGGNQNSGGGFGLGSILGGGGNNGRRHFWDVLGGNNGYTAPGSGFGSNISVLFAGDLRVANKIRRVQNKLNKSNLSPAERTSLMGRLSQLQSEQSTLRSTLNSDIFNRQNTIQSMLAGGNLSRRQRRDLQNELSRLQQQQNGLSTNTGFFGSVRNFFTSF